jgi:hypothetical protein
MLLIASGLNWLASDTTFTDIAFLLKQDPVLACPDGCSNRNSAGAPAGGSPPGIRGLDVLEIPIDAPPWPKGA